MDHHEQVVARRPEDALAQPAQIAHDAAFDCRQRRIDGAKKERAGNADALEPPPDDARAQRVQIEFDVRTLGHGGRSGQGR